MSRDSCVEAAEPNVVARTLAATIKRNFEGLGI